MCFTFLHAFSAWAQSESCGFDAIIQSAIQENPTYQTKLDEFDQLAGSSGTCHLPVGEYEIPVVVHIMHDNGLEYILDAQVHAAIDQLNQQFAGEEGGDDTLIRFTLAAIDPDGNCTDGIVRVQTPNPYGYPYDYWADIAMKNLSRWPTEKYLNIWVVRQLFDQNDILTSAITGYAPRPPFISSDDEQFDGVVIRYNYLGNTEAADGNIRNVLTHEIGHYLSLYHPWGPFHESGLTDCELGCHDVNEPICRERGDRVCDTAPCYKDYQPDAAECSQPLYNQCGSNGCPDSGEPYPADNYMSYAHECHTRFTPDQMERMYCILNTFRANIWSENNKACTGLNTEWDDRLVLQNETWSTANLPNNGDITITGDLTIASGATLTIQQGVTVRFCGGSRVLVRPNARLYLAGTLTNSCGAPWKGVEVWGSNNNLGDTDPDVNTSQYYMNGAIAQGYVSCTSGAVIENAETGIQLWGPTEDDAGGQLKCTNTTFKNNEVAIDFAPYENYWPHSVIYQYGQPRNYVGYISRCTFITDDDYQFTDNVALQRTPFDAFLKMSGVNGVSINGSSFTNSQSLPSANATTDYGYGILATNSGFRVYPSCTSPYYPCNSYLRSTFEGLGCGIYTGNTTLSRPYTVKQADFIDCFVGVHNSAVSNGTMLFNDFQLGNVPKPDIIIEQQNGQVIVGQVGVVLENSISGFTFQENNFNGTAGNATMTVGTVSKNIGAFNNLIRRNQYSNLSYGNISNGNNAQPVSTFFADRGLHYLCNTNANINQYDFAVVIDENTNTGINQIRRSQGLESEFDGNIIYDAAGNRFSHTGTDFRNDGLPVDYYYFAGDSEQVPLNYTGIELEEAPENSCSVTYCEPPCVDSDGLAGIKGDYYDSKSNELTALTQMQVALDAGNTTLAMQREREAAYYKQRMDKDAFMVVLHVLHDTLTFDPDTLDIWIENLDVLGMDLFFALKSQSEGKTAKAQAAMQKALNRQGLNKSQNDDLADMPELLRVLENKSPYQLKKQDLKELKKLSEKDESFVGNIARNILTMYGHRFPVTYRLPERRETIVPTTSLPTHHLMIYPNPNSGVFNVIWTPDNTVQESAILHVMDVTGKIVKTTNINPMIQNQLNLDAPTGIYFYQLNTTKGTSESGKFIIQ
mgnify:FL=1